MYERPGQAGVFAKTTIAQGKNKTFMIRKKKKKSL